MDQKDLVRLNVQVVQVRQQRRVVLVVSRGEHLVVQIGDVVLRQRSYEVRQITIETSDTGFDQRQWAGQVLR
ncbi:hypothetical protein D3C86_1675890 [compost metagenome]